jgi:putative integral membrane protein (TIGR02587 family)
VTGLIAMLTGRSRARESGEPGPWQKEAADFARAFSGAFLFGMPLLYTMEMWWIGESIETPRLLIFLVVAFVVNLGLASMAGFKRTSTFRNHFDQAMDAVAVGVVGSAIVLAVLNQIKLDEPIESMLGKLIVQAVPLSIGATAANLIFSRDSGDKSESPDDVSPWLGLLKDIGATAAGALFLAFAIAPTDEISMIAGNLGPIHVVALICLSLVVSYAIVFASGFDPQRWHHARQHAAQGPVGETLLAYFVSVAVACGSLFLLERIGAGDSLQFVITQTLVLALPACVGGAAGRIAM